MRPERPSPSAPDAGRAAGGRSDPETSRIRRVGSGACDPPADRHRSPNPVESVTKPVASSCSGGPGPSPHLEDSASRDGGLSGEGRGQERGDSPTGCRETPYGRTTARSGESPAGPRPEEVGASRSAPGQGTSPPRVRPLPPGEPRPRLVSRQISNHPFADPGPRGAEFRIRIFSEPRPEPRARVLEQPSHHPILPSVHVRRTRVRRYEPRCRSGSFRVRRPSLRSGTRRRFSGLPRGPRENLAPWRS